MLARRLGHDPNATLAVYRMPPQHAGACFLLGSFSCDFYVIKLKLNPSFRIQASTVAMYHKVFVLHHTAQFYLKYIEAKAIVLSVAL